MRIAIISTLCGLLILMSSHLIAEVKVKRPYETGIFISNYQDYKEGEIYISSNKQKIADTNNIPAKLGTRFGVRYELDYMPYEKPLRVKLLYLTPGIINPINGERQDKIEVVQDLSPDSPHYLIAYEFSEEYEIVPGEWRMFVFVNDRMLLEETFIVEYP